MSLPKSLNKLSGLNGEIPIQSATSSIAKKLRSTDNGASSSSSLTTNATDSMNGLDADDSWSFDQFFEPEEDLSMTGLNDPSLLRGNTSIDPTISRSNSSGTISSSKPACSYGVRDQSNSKRVAVWTPEEDNLLLQIVQEVGADGNW